MDSHNSPQENDAKGSGEELKDALFKSSEPFVSDDKKPVGPFEHSGEVAGWTETEEKQEKSRESDLQQTDTPTESSD